MVTTRFPNSKFLAFNSPSGLYVRSPPLPGIRGSLMQWIVHMQEYSMPVAPRLIGDWANWAPIHAGRPDQQVGANWAYRFRKQLPGLNLGPVKQKTKESKRIQAEDASFLTY